MAVSNIPFTNALKVKYVTSTTNEYGEFATGVSSNRMRGLFVVSPVRSFATMTPYDSIVQLSSINNSSTTTDNISHPANTDVAIYVYYA